MTCQTVRSGMRVNLLLLSLVYTACWAVDWPCSAMWSDQSFNCDITDHTSSSPGEGIIALVPIYTASSATFQVTIYGTHKVFRPATRGCVAHDPPSAILCFPSKKSAFHRLAGLDGTRAEGELPVYPGYNSIGLNPSCLSNTVLVHSHTPPISPRPDSLLPFCVTGVGW